MPSERADHFESMEVQAHAAKLGMWIFLCSEIFLFAGLFVLFAAYRTEDPAGFHTGVTHAERVLGSINTVVLLTSSTTMALGVHAMENGHAKRARRLVLLTSFFGLVFLVIKLCEYAKHLGEGIVPGGSGEDFIREHGAPQFWTLYYVMTGLHGIHVLVGASLLLFAAHQIRNRAISSSNPHRLEIFGLYWHLIDVIWIFLWPLFYLA